MSTTNVHYLLVAILLLSLLWNACEKDKLVVVEGVETLEIHDCVELNTTPNMLIDTAEEYATLLDEHRLEEPNCIYYEAPEFNFEEITILGQLTDVETCNALYQYEVLADLEEEAYIFRVRMNLEQSSDCNERQKRSHWVSIPKLPENYKVKFETALE